MVSLPFPPPQEQPNSSENVAYNDEYYSPPDVSEDSLKWLEDPDELKTFLVKRWRGERFNYNTKQWEKTGNAYMNEEGIRSFEDTLHMFVNRGTSMSRLTEKQIADMCTQLYVLLGELVAENRENFDVYNKSFTHMRKICLETSYLVYIWLKKSENEGERKFWSRSGRRTEMHSVGQQSGKRSFLPF